MEFNQKLNDYMHKLHCSAKTLAEVSDLSPTVLSRYRNGELVPLADSIYLRKLSSGIAVLAAEYGIPGLTTESVMTSFVEILNAKKSDPMILASNLNQLITVLGINQAELSRYLNYDPSYLSRICSGQRSPANLEKFIMDCCQFIMKRYSRDTDKAAVATLLHCSQEDLMEEYSYQSHLLLWFGHQNAFLNNSEPLAQFLNQLNDPNQDLPDHTPYDTGLDLYLAPDQERLESFLLSDAEIPGDRMVYTPAPPLFVIHGDFLRSILSNRNLPPEQMESIIDAAHIKRSRMEKILAHSRLTLALPLISKEAFQETSIPMHLSDAFCSQRIPYTYEQYEEHLRALLEFSIAHPNFSYRLVSDAPLLNLRIYLRLGKWSMISRMGHPTAHYLVRQPELRTALEKIVLPLVE